MKIFILEDDENRISYFKERLRTEDLHISRTAKEAKRMLLSSDKWDVIFLDHDLGGLVYVDSNEEETGYQIAKFIKENNLKYGRVILHTMNSHGALNMKSILKNAEIIPFSILNLTIEEN